MSDWQVGDLAVCVDARTNPEYLTNPLADGAIYRVREVAPPRYWSLGNSTNSPGLFFEEVPCPGLWGFASERFRKIRPDEHEGNAEDWQLLRETHKRKVSA